MIEKIFDGANWIEGEPSLDGQEYRVYLTETGYSELTYMSKSKEDIEREWRDSELQSTDWIVPVTDHPQHADYLTYRQALRDYPSQLDFPNGTRPTL